MEKSRALRDQDASGIDSVAEFKKRTDRAQTIWFYHITAAFLGLAVATRDNGSQNARIAGATIAVVSFLTGFIRVQRVRRCPVCEEPLRGRYGWGYAVGNRTCQSCDALLTEK